MQRRLFIRSGSAAVAAAALSACGGGGEGSEGALTESLLDAEARANPNKWRIPGHEKATPAPAPAPDPTPAPAPAPSEIYTFQQEFENPLAPLLRADGGPFDPYFQYFGGDAQPDGPNGYRWWNDELQVYTTSRYTPAPYNPFKVANGCVSISGIRSTYSSSPKPYLSGSLDTSKGAWWDSQSVRDARGGFEQKYGYWEARVRIPKDKGLWPAFWLTGGITSTSNGKMGELDIFECVGDGKIHQTAHDWWASSHPYETKGYVAPFDYSADFHTYGLLWTPTEIAWYVDGVETHKASAGMVARYRDLCGPMYLCFNLAIGGGWPGSPDSSTRFPATMDIDYIRVRAA
ncbi:glycoside hydrolase family 16 protein [Ramlibacter sp.]|uniref:glycoside hydrolase family 16 protein n=1 Tax=Ramlibacter sp. TaxID=1917967 RepID=UPI002FCBF706